MSKYSLQTYILRTIYIIAILYTIYCNIYTNHIEIHYKKKTFTATTNLPRLNKKYTDNNILLNSKNITNKHIQNKLNDLLWKYINYNNKLTSKATTKYIFLQ